MSKAVIYYTLPLNIILNDAQILGRDLPLPRRHVPRLVRVLAAGRRPHERASAAFTAGLGHKVASLLQQEK